MNAAAQYAGVRPGSFDRDSAFKLLDPSSFGTKDLLVGFGCQDLKLGSGAGWRADELRQGNPAHRPAAYSRP